MSEIGGGRNVYLAHHAEIFDRQRYDLAFFQLVKADAARKDGNTEVTAYQILYRCDVVHLKYHVEIAYAQIIALKMRHEQVSRSRVGQTQYHPLLFELGKRDHTLFGKRMIGRNGKYKIIRVHKQIFYAGIVYPALYYRYINIVCLEHGIKIAYSVCNHFNVNAVVLRAVFRQRFGYRVALRGVRNADREVRRKAFAV